MDEYNENQMKLYSGEFLKTISDSSASLKSAIDKKDKSKICELLTQYFVDNLFTCGKIRILLGFDAERLSQEEIDNIQRKILELIK